MKVTSTVLAAVKVTVACAVAVLAMLAPAVAAADPPTRVTIVAVFNPITYGENAYVNGQLIGDGQPGQAVSLEQAAPPYTDWTPVAQGVADAQGYYSFKLHPTQTMQYRTNSQGVFSERAVEVDVAPRITLKAVAAGRSTIRYRGTFGPALEGQSVAIQRRDAAGSWTTIANATLRGGTSFSGRLTAHRATTLRAFFATDGMRPDTYSNSVIVKPGTKRTSASAAACSAPRITRITTRPAQPMAARAFTLRVTGALARGRIRSIDVLWGDGDARDHFTLAPAARRSKVTFALRHRYAAAGRYRLRIRIRAVARGCGGSTVVAHRALTVARTAAG